MLAIGLDRVEKCEIRSIMGKNAGAAHFSAAPLTQCLTLSIFRATGFFRSFNVQRSERGAEAAGYGEDWFLHFLFTHQR